MKILIIHGPNLNLLGKRETEIYGSKTLEDINANLQKQAESLSIEIENFQSNHEGDIVDKIQATDANGVLINPAAFTHTSLSIRDAVLARKIPILEVHLSNIYSREEFRRHSFLSDIALAVICGLGPKGYEIGLQELCERLKK